MKRYTVEMLEQAYRREYPDLTEEEVKEKAQLLHKKIDALDTVWRRSNRRFRQMNELV